MQMIVLCGIGIAVLDGKDPVQRPVYIFDAVRRSGALCMLCVMRCIQGCCLLPVAPACVLTA
jgi:hypothetical protein